MHLAQVLPCPAGVAAKIGSAVTGFLKNGHIFSVPMERLCRPHAEGGLGLLHPRWKPLSMFVGRWESSARQGGQLTGAWLRTLEQLYDRPEDVPSKVAYFKVFLQHSSKLVPLLKGRTLARTLYRDLLEEHQPPPVRVEVLQPQHDWPAIWRAANAPGIHPCQKAEWYLLLHDVVPVRDRLFSKRLVESPTCARCGKPDTLAHRLVKCNQEGQREWEDCARRTAALLGLPIREVTPELLLHPALTGDGWEEAAALLCKTATGLHKLWIDKIVK